MKNNCIFPLGELSFEGSEALLDPESKGYYVGLFSEWCTALYAMLPQGVVYAVTPHI